jgi:hypothetical protein
MTPRLYAMIFPVLLLALIACGQDKPVAPPQITVSAPEPSIPDFPPPVTDQSDRRTWREAQYGKHPIILTTEKKMPNTGERLPEEARTYVEHNDTWAANLGEDLQMILNLVEYKPGLNLNISAISNNAAEQFRSDPGVSGFAARQGDLSIPGAEQSLRLDGTVFRDGLIHFFCIATARRGQTIWQMSFIYPEVYQAGPGDVEAILASMRIPE